MMPLTSTKPVLSAADVPVSLPLELYPEHPKVGQGMALLALSHSTIEHRVYLAMHSETLAVHRTAGSFTVRRLLALSGLRSYGSVGRGCSGLIKKLSIENIGGERNSVYRVHSPDEIFVRRSAAGISPYPVQVRGYEKNRAFRLLMQHVVDRDDITRREAFVVLCCAQGLSNAEIGERLLISEQTVKSHLRQIFGKFGVRRRTELVSWLLTQGGKKRKRGKLELENQVVVPALDIH